MTDWDTTTLPAAIDGLRERADELADFPRRLAATTEPFINLDPDEPSGMFRCDHGTVFDRGDSGWELVMDTGCPCFARKESLDAEAQ